MLMVLKAFFGLQPNDPIMKGVNKTAKQYAQSFVRDRSRILHGTWSTLNSRLASDRRGTEEFVIGVIRQAAFELERYALTDSPDDDVDAFLAWVERNQPETATS
jgi:hypothetical protein